MNFRLAALTLALACGLSSAVFAADTNTSRITYDKQCFTIDGKDTFLYSGSFHYFRCPKPLWADRFQKLKDAGFNTVETYVAWNWHEQQPPSGPDDFSKVDMTDFTDWLDMAINKFGFYVILRPGPYICAEWDGGGYPQWLVTKRPVDARKDWLRSDDQTYLDWCKHWYTAVAKATIPFQITHMPAGKPGVIMWQIENEYNYAGFPAETKLHQLQALAHDSRDLGIDVPLITCMTHDPLYRKDPFLLQNVIECRNSYPKFSPENELKDIMVLKDYQPEKPRMITELQGGWFSDVGHQLSEDMGFTPQQLTHVTLLAWANGFTGSNYYMAFGGTNIGDWGAADKTTTYDYAAPLREWGGIGPRYFAVQAMANFLKEHAAQLLRSTPVEMTGLQTPEGTSAYLRRGSDGSQFLFVFNNQEQTPLKGDLQLPSGITGTIHFELDPYDGKILYLPAGETDAAKGVWYPQAVTPPTRPTNLPQPIKITEIRRQLDPGPTSDSWQDLPDGASIEDVGIFDRRYVFYRASLPASMPKGAALAMQLGPQHAVVANVNGQNLNLQRRGPGFMAADLPALANGDNQVLALFENGGRYNGGDGLNDRCGLLKPMICDSASLPVSFADWKRKVEPGDAEKDVNTEPDQSWATVQIGRKANQVAANTTDVFRSQINLSDADLSTGKKVINFGTLSGEHRVFFNGKEITPDSHKHYDVTSDLKSGMNTLAVIVTAGSHAAGIANGVEFGSEQFASSAPLHWQISAQTAGYAGNWQDPAFDDSKWDQVSAGTKIDSPANAPLNLTWYRLKFALPAADPHVWAPWKLHLEAVGNGFIYLNGHALGRWWEVGPQNDFFLPECWMNFGPNATNVIALCMRPTKAAPQINAAEVSTYEGFAESR
jgi:glycosyl hydrolase family 35/beta-galactosidase-like protein